MSEAVLVEALCARFPDAAPRPLDSARSVVVKADRLREHLFFLRDQLHFDFLTFMTAIDRPSESRLEIIYRLFSYTERVALMVRTFLPRDGARMDTVSDIYRTAEWHEREAAEMFGIAFTNHPDLRKLLLPDDLDGHPLLKDFSHPNMRRLPEVP